MNDQPITVTRNLVKRAWSDIEPKIAIGLASGTFATGILEVAKAYGVHMPSTVQAGLPFFLAMFAGYLTPSVGANTTIRTGTGLVVEKHGGSVEIKTGAIPLPGYQGDANLLPAYVASLKAAESTPIPAPEPDPAPAPAEVPDAMPTQVYSRGAAFLNTLGASKPDIEDAH